MYVLKYQDHAVVKLQADDDLFTFLCDPKRQLEGYQHSLAVVRSDETLMKRRKQPWWLAPGDEITAPKLDPHDNRTVTAAPDRCHHFQLTRAPQVIDVYLGFMDEEVNARLNVLIQQETAKPAHRQRPVLLIERGAISPDQPILEWRVGNYAIAGKNSPVRKVIHVSPQGEIVKWQDGKKSTSSVSVGPDEKARFWEDRERWLKEQASGDNVSTAPEDILGRALGVFMETEIASDLDWLSRGLPVKKYFDIIKLLQHRGNPKTKSQLPAEATGSGPWLSVIRFAVGNDHRAPIVVIRSPEMGLQPSLMCPYLAFLLKALSAASSELAAADAKRINRVTVGKNGWDKAEFRKELWEEADSSVYRDGKKLKKWDISEWPLRVSQFGAQGSTSVQTNQRPGTIVTVVGSLFVGVEIASDITLSSKSPEQNSEFEYRHAVDGTEDAPAWQARESQSSNTAPSLPQSGRDRIIKQEKTDLHAYAVISLCTPAGVYDFLRRPVHTARDLSALRAEFGLENPDRAAQNDLPLKDPITSAQDIAAEVFRSQSTESGRAKLKVRQKLIDKESPFFEFEQSIADKATLAQVIASLQRAYTGSFFQRNENREGVFTLTVSYFGGDEDKAAADALGLKGVAMEDYHVIRVLRSALTKGVLESSDYPIILGWRVDRINCDPKVLPPGIERTFNDFCRISPKSGESKPPKGVQATLTIEDYIRTIIWGLRGVLRKDIESSRELRDTVNWRFLEDRAIFPDTESLQPYFWSFVHAEGGDRFWVPDPFCIEIATDFINELAAMKPGIAGFGERPERGRIMELAKAVLDAWRTEDQGKSSFEAVYQSKSATGTTAAARALMTYLGSPEQFGLDIGNRADRVVKTWLRPEKWAKGIVTAATLQDAADRGQFKAAAIDRAFYKSSNMMALQTYAAHGL